MEQGPGQLVHQQRWQYDPAGNRLPPGTPPGSHYPANRIGEDATDRYHFDAWGNVSHIQRHDGTTLALHYDGLHQLRQSQTHHPSARSEHRRITTVHYHYDALGRRYRKRSEQRTAAGEQQPVQDTFYGWDGDRLVTIQAGQESSTVIYEPESFVPLLRVDRKGVDQQPSTRLLHYHCNHLDTPLALIDARQQKGIWQAELDPWGNRLEEFNPEGIGQDIRMQGQHHDEETGLFYNRYRYYVPHAGRHLTQDPVGLDGGINTYLLIRPHKD